MTKKKIDLLGDHFPLTVIGSPGFWKKFTPAWFQFLGWILAIGAIEAIHKVTSNVSLRFFVAISYMALAFYIADHLSSYHFTFPFIDNEKYARIFSILLSTVLAIFIWLFVSSVIDNIGLSSATSQAN